jgi:hypothetical protein
VTDDELKQLIETAPKYSIPLTAKAVQELTEYLIEDKRLVGEKLAGAVFDELLNTLFYVLRLQDHPTLEEEDREDCLREQREAIASILVLYVGEELERKNIIAICQKIITWRPYLDRGMKFEPWKVGDKPSWAAVKVQEVRRIAHPDGYRYRLEFKSFSGRSCGQIWTSKYTPAGVYRIGKEIGFPRFPDKPTNPYDISGLWFTTLLRSVNGSMVMDIFTRSSSMINTNRKLLQGRQGPCILGHADQCFHCPLGRDRCWLARVAVTPTEKKTCMNYKFGDHGREYHEGFIEDTENHVCYSCMQTGPLNKEIRGITQGK